MKACANPVHVATQADQTVWFFQAVQFRQDNRELTATDLEAQIGVLIGAGRDTGKGCVECLAQSATDNALGSLPFPPVQQTGARVSISNVRAGEYVLPLHSPVPGVDCRKDIGLDV